MILHIDWIAFTREREERHSPRPLGPYFNRWIRRLPFCLGFASKEVTKVERKWHFCVAGAVSLRKRGSCCSSTRRAASLEL